jgi:acyl-CoA thioester hydrolase
MPFRHPVRVQFFEVDLQGVVFNMWYLAWFDTAMSTFMATLGFPYDDTNRDGWDVQLVHTELDWRGSARFGDEVIVEVETARIGTTSFTLAYRVLRGDELLVTAETVYVVVGIDGSGKRPVPDDLRTALSA